jgi:hypothetical protein
MKNILFSIILLLLSNINFSQEVDVPQISLDYFQKEFNTHNESQNIQWSKNEIGFEVYFEYNDKKRTALFDELGSFKEYRIFVNQERLNSKVKDYLNENFSGSAIIQCYEVTSNSAPERNEVEIEINGNITTLFFRPNGDFHYQK